MFNSISWQTYLYVIAVCVASYYIIAILLLYYKEIARYLRKETSDDTPVVGPPTTNLMGAIKPDPGIRHAFHQKTDEADKIIVAENLTDSVSPEFEVGPSISDLLRDIKTLTSVIVENNGTMEQSVPMYKTLLQRNSHLAESNYREAINQFLSDQCNNLCGFKIELTEIRTWWNS